MPDNKYYITEEGLQQLKDELDRLVHETRAEVIEELKEARAQGDLSENADYDAARDHQAQVEARINTYTIVGTIEADPLNGKLSNVTPLAEAILDQKVGDIVTVKVDDPYQVKIIAVK